METAVFGFVGALIGSILGFIGSLFSAFGKSKDTQLDVRTKVVTNERAQWRKDMRELAAAYVVLSNQLADTSKPNEEYNNEFERTRVLIRLRLNGHPGHKLDAKILRALQAIAVYAKDKKLDSLKAELEGFEFDMQTLLKREWDKSKGEAESGNIAISDKYAT